MLISRENLPVHGKETKMNEHHERDQRPSPHRMSPFSTRVAGVAPARSGSRPMVREMERPRTESYGELWRRANNRLSRF
jgi:hypothetical protein